MLIFSHWCALLVVLTVPAGQVAEETIIEEEEEEEETLPLVKRPRMAEMANSAEEMKVLDELSPVGGEEGGKRVPW